MSHRASPRSEGVANSIGLLLPALSGMTYHHIGIRDPATVPGEDFDQKVVSYLSNAIGQHVAGLVGTRREDECP